MNLVDRRKEDRRRHLKSLPPLPDRSRPPVMGRFEKRQRERRGFAGLRPSLFLGLSLLFGACATQPRIAVHDPLPADSPRGYVEFYCSQCITGWAVYQVIGGQETYLAQMDLGRQVADTIRSPSKAKRLRIAHSPGTFHFILRLLPRDSLSGPSLRFEVDVRQDMISPVRLNFRRQTEMRFEWDIIVGRPLPLEAMDPTQGTLRAALDDADWGLRWYAAQSLEHTKDDLSEPALDRLSELASAEAYDSCLGTATVTECYLIQDQAARVLDKIRKKNEVENEARRMKPGF